jgi:hypothetical protein
MQVVYEEYLNENCKSLILSNNADNQHFSKKHVAKMLLKNCCRTIVGSHVTNRIVVGNLTEK